jgi:hypothetical protein
MLGCGSRALLCENAKFQSPLGLLTAGPPPCRSRARARRAVGYVPVPVSVTERPPPPPFTSRKAVFAPSVVGLKIASIVQVAWPASDVPQSSVKSNCFGAAPLSAMPVIARALGLVFVTVTDCAALEVLIGRLPKASARGASVSTEGTSACPAIATDISSSPAAKGKPATALKAPVEFLMVYAETVFSA